MIKDLIRRIIHIIPVVALTALTALSAHAQTQADNLNKQLSSATSDTAKARIYYSLAQYYLNYETVEQGDSCADLAVEFALKSGSDKHIADAYVAKAQALDYSGEYDLAIKKYEEGIALIDTNECTTNYGTLLQGIANAYYFKAQPEYAQQYYYRSLKVREQAGDSTGMAGSMMGMANVYSDNGQFQQSLTLYKTALGIEERFQKTRMVSWLLNNIGSIYVQLNDLDSALYFFNRSIIIKKELGDNYGLSTTYNNIGEIYLIKKNPRAALYYFRLAYEIRLVNESSHELASSYLDIGKTYLDLGVTDSANLWLDSAITLSKRADLKKLLYQSYYHKALALNLQGESQAAFGLLLESMKIKDSVMSEESSQQVNDLVAKYGAEQQAQKIALQNAELESASTFRNFLYVIIVLAGVIIVFAIVAFVRKQKTNKLLETKNEEIRFQHKLVEEKNKDIIDSITYAKRIQGALLPSETRMQSLLPESFVVYKPRDIVSGDFYLVEEWGKETIVAAIDCTGHGVPGAFMSFMAYDLFQEAVMEHGITKPAAILSRMRSGVTKMLGRESETVYDGMDAAICTLNESKTLLTYSGAHRPLWMFRNGEFSEFKETKCSVSPSEYDQLNFETHEIPVQRGDTFYIFSDGYADQFGGPQAKKFKLSRLKQLLTDFHKSPMPYQEERVLSAFAAWKGPHEQVDDVLLIGFRIP